VFVNAITLKLALSRSISTTHHLPEGALAMQLEFPQVQPGRAPIGRLGRAPIFPGLEQTVRSKTRKAMMGRWSAAGDLNAIVLDRP
jgi:hypothetical protein